MTEGEVCLDRAKMAETQRQTQLDRASAVKKALYKRKRIPCFHDEARLATIGSEFRSHLGNVGALDKCAGERDARRLARIGAAGETQ